MNRLTPRLSGLVLVLAALALAPAAWARVDSEVGTTDKRKAAVEKAALFAKRTKAAMIPATLPQPFAPPSFELTDAEEAAAAAAAARLAGGSPVAAGPTDHELLTEIVQKVRPSGSAFVGGAPLLMFGSRFVRTGTHFTVTFKGSDYDLELTQIDGTNFTLRYKSEEITRPILAAKPAKSP
jgi:hypothetical protein